MDAARSNPRWPWALGGALAGIAAGAAVTRGGPWSLAPVAIVAGGAFAVFAWRRLDIALLALIFTLPLDVYGRVVTRPVPVTLFQLGLLACLGAWAVRIVQGRDRLEFSVVDVGIAGLLAAGLWSLPGSLAPGETVVAVARIAFLWAFTLMYANVVRTRELALRVFAVLVVTGTAVGLLALAQYAVPGLSLGVVLDVRAAGGGTALSRASGLFDDPNYLAGFLSACVAASGVMIAHARRWAAALMWAAGGTVCGLATLVTFSRSGWVGALVGLGVVAVTAPRGRRAWLVAAGVALALSVAVFAPSAVVDRAQSFTDLERDRSNATRYYMALSTVEMIRDDWVYGTGLGAFDQAFPRYRKPGTYISIVRPHTLPLALWAETGVAGLLAELVLTGGLVFVHWRRRPNGWGAVEAAALAGLLALLVQSLFQYYLYFEYVWLFLALSVAASRIVRAEEVG